MGILDDLKKWAHPYEDEDEEYEDDFPDLRDRGDTGAFADRRSAERKAEDRRNKVVNINATTQLKVVLVKPERFENASEIADHLKEKRTVVINLESTNKDIARRLIDFLSGVAYAGEGKIKKVAANTYIITPYHVDIMGDLIDELEKRTGRKIIGNKAASGTEILDELAEREIENGELIVYTSADSVLQICGNEETMGLETLYHYCEIARELTMKDEWKVGRVIARPYVGKKKGEFVRTANRHDYAVKPTGKTVLNAMQEAGYDVISIGKINDIFCGEGITESLKSKSSVHGMEQTIETAGKEFTGLCFVNLVDFDALWGHRRNPEGYGKEIEKFDVNLGKLLEQLKDDDLLLITADHGNDPTYTGTDHTREQVPLLAYSPSMKESGLQETKDTFAVIGASVAENFGVKMPEGTIGTSILESWK